MQSSSLRAVASVCRNNLFKLAQRQEARERLFRAQVLKREKGKRLLAWPHTMWPSALLVYYGVVFSWYAFFLYGNSYFFIKPEGSLPMGHYNPFEGSPWKYLTYLNMVLQAIFYAIVLLTSIFVLMKKRRIAMILISFKDLIFSTLVFPLATFVFGFFWSVFLYDRELIYPKYIDSIIPGWINHSMHTVIFPLSLVEIFVTPHQYPSVGKGFCILGTAALGYQLWILYFFAKTGQWIYPFLKFLSPLGMIALAGVGTVTLAFGYMLGRFLNHIIWGDTVLVLDVYKKKSK